MSQSGTCLVPIYTTFESVKIRLVNKVQFQAEPSVLQEGELPNELLAQIISDAETFVEQDFRSRYKVPFQSRRTGRYQDLPDHSKRALRTAVDFKAVELILGTDFGRGTHVNADNYVKFARETYKAYVIRMLGHDPEAEEGRGDVKRFRFAPPLDDVALAATNQYADDGYKGTIINTDASRNDAEAYAAQQINNPAASYINRRLNNGAE